MPYELENLIDATVRLIVESTHVVALMKAGT